MNEDEKTEYLDRISALLTECLTTHEGSRHALLIVANDDTESLSLYSINAKEEILGPLVKAAAKIVATHTDTGSERVLN